MNDGSHRSQPPLARPFPDASGFTSRVGDGPAFFVRLTMRNAFSIMACTLFWSACATHTQMHRLSVDQGYNLACKVNDMLSHIAANDAAAARSYKAMEPRASKDFPFALWPAEVRQLHPVAVYDYHGNVVIVMRRNAHEEEGYYIVNFEQHVFSSQFPDPNEFPNDPGWNLKPIENHDAGSLYEYHRKKN